MRDFFQSDPHGAVAVYLFGSVARGTAKEKSDVDVATLYPQDPPRAYEARFGSRASWKRCCGDGCRWWL